MYGGEVGRHIHGTGLPIFTLSSDRAGWNYGHHGQFWRRSRIGREIFFWACYASGGFDYALSGRQAKEGTADTGGRRGSYPLYIFFFFFFYMSRDGHGIMTEGLTNLPLVTGCISQGSLEEGSVRRVEIRRETRPKLETNVQ